MSFRNFYQCPTCKTEWEDVWDCQVDEECPECGERAISPAHSESLVEPSKAKRDFFSAQADTDGTWYVNSYRVNEAGEIRRETLIERISEESAAKIVERGNAFIAAIREAREK